ncbi:hypothetical protein FPV67DRAFT_1752198 [Lyophyllum atratum]|nr:hypothetical protein FPV67DRAFT_1752198 [Lyophyllum atratum]
MAAMLRLVAVPTEVHFNILSRVLSSRDPKSQIRHEVAWYCGCFHVLDQNRCEAVPDRSSRVWKLYRCSGGLSQGEGLANGRPPQKQIVIEKVPVDKWLVNEVEALSMATNSTKIADIADTYETIDGPGWLGAAANGELLKKWHRTRVSVEDEAQIPSHRGTEKRDHSCTGKGASEAFRHEKPGGDLSEKATEKPITNRKRQNMKGWVGSENPRMRVQEKEEHRKSERICGHDEEMRETTNWMTVVADQRAQIRAMYIRCRTSGKGASEAFRHEKPGGDLSEKATEKPEEKQAQRRIGSLRTMNPPGKQKGEAVLYP